MANEENLKPWPKGQSGNPKGRPKGLVSTILEGLKDKGELVTKKLVTETYQVFLSLPKSALREIQKDKKQPTLNRILAENMLSDKGFEIIEKMMDRANGKPTQMQDITQSTEEKHSIDLGNLTDEQLEQLSKLAAIFTADTSGES